MTINTSLIGKIMGWGQFALTALGQVATAGLPATPIGWVSLFASLAMAIGTHAASSTDGVK
jgi:hypothetical protein